MVDPTKRSNNIDPNNVPGNRTIDPVNRPAVRNRRTYAWAWIIGIIIVVLIIWAFFGRNHESRVVNPAMQPAAASSTVR